MNELTLFKIGAAAAVVWGVKLILFGGTKKTGTYIELFGFEFGTGEREDMSTFECWFVGLALILGGGYFFKSMVWG
ncbi:MAG: hypothetical protein ABW067_08790 [Rhizobacter sp.]